jgi:hypothetical protein
VAAFHCSRATTSRRPTCGHISELIRARTGEGHDRAEAKGVKMGRKPTLTDHQKREAIKRRKLVCETPAPLHEHAARKRRRGYIPQDSNIQ